jgi:hypothetical protein
MDTGQGLSVCYDGCAGDAAIDGISTNWLEGCGSDHGVVPDIGDTEATLASRDAEEPAVEMESGGDVATIGIGEWPGVADAGPVLVGEDGGEWREWPSAQLDPQGSWQPCTANGVLILPLLNKLADPPPPPPPRLVSSAAPTDTVDYDGSSGQSQRLSPSTFT